MPTNTDDVTVLDCSECGAIVEVCSFCERPDCPVKVCYRCLRIDVGQTVDHPHDHGG
jgi:hypothetical protein